MGKAWLLLIGTDLSIASPTPFALTASAHEGHSHPVTDTPSVHVGTHLDHHASEFVAGHMRECDVIVTRPGMPVAPAHPRGLHLYHRTSVGCGGLSNLPHFRLSADSIKNNCTHNVILAASRSDWLREVTSGDEQAGTEFGFVQVQEDAVAVGPPAGGEVIAEVLNGSLLGRSPDRVPD